MPKPTTIAAALLLLLARGAATPAPSAAEVQWELLNRLETETRPLDVAVSADGKSVFVLAEGGTVLIFAADGKLMDKLAVGPQAERIAVDPEGERLYVTHRQGKRVDVIQIDYIREINIAGAPFKGGEKAPVTIAVFSDFQ
jgi:DNA-binding beta-propeller fold protein YncE